MDTAAAAMAVTAITGTLVAGRDSKEKLSQADGETTVMVAPTALKAAATGRCLSQQFSTY